MLTHRALRGQVGLSLLAVVASLLGGERLAAQAQDAMADPWEPLRLLEGSWDGSIDGVLGRGVGRRTYEFIFDDLYLVSRHASVRLPQDQSPEGDHHREFGVYSYDRERGMLVLREFMVEGYVLRSTCETGPMRFVCTAEEVESGSGIRARLTIEISDAFHFTEIYELAMPGKPLRRYLTNAWTRVPDLGTSGPR